MYYLETGYDKNARFRNAVAIALAVHAVLILGISFGAANSSYQAPQIEVTLATRPSTYAPDDALNIAESNQQGSGDMADLDQVTSNNNLPMNSPAQQMVMPRQQTQDSAAQQDAVTTTAVARQKLSAAPTEQKKDGDSTEGINPEVDRLSREVAGLQAEFDQQTRTYSTKPRVRRLTAASARQSVDAAYLLDWRRRLEAVGNQYYPEASIRYGIYGNVRLLVIIRSDGSLEDVKVLSSSGYAVLDEAAIKVVRMAAPYSPFPAELKATTDKLEIVRTWQYLESQLSSN